MQPISQLTSVQELYLSYNYFEGNLSAFSSMQSLSHLSAHNNLLTGDLSGLYGLVSLGYIRLYRNLLTGSLSPLQSLSNLYHLDLFGNSITGTLAPLENLTNMTYLDMSINSINGTLKPVSQLTSLQHLYLNRNLVTGTISCLSAIKSTLQYLYLFQNDLSGDLQVLRELTTLIEVSLYNNHFEDNLEPFRDLRNLTYLDVENNYITGSISDIAALTNMKYMYLSTNLFSVQPISALAGFTGLVDLGLLENHFTGSTELFSTFTSLEYLEINDNYFSKDISSWHTLTHLTQVDISRNLLTGSLDSLAVCTGLTQVDAGYNLLSGTIDVFEGMTQLRYFNVEGCGLTGALPNSLSLCTELTYLNLNSNYFTGTVPSLADATYLTALLLSNNELSGALDYVSPSTSNPFTYLTVIDIHNNRFSGSIPAGWFGLTNIEYIIAAVNCLEVTFPASVCDMTSLEGLVLDGLHSAPSCSYKLPIRIIDTIYQTTQVVSDVPACIYELPALYTLHLSGNGITTPLPSDVAVSSSLKELVLSNNDIRGVIPDSFQKHPFDILDLSYNKISGMLDEWLVVNNSISLLVNRLSGPIPSTLYSTKTVDILSGNIYSCDKHTIQRLNDATVGSSYTCGSSTFTYAAIIWFVVIALIVALVAVSYASPEQVEVQCLRGFVEYARSVRESIVQTLAVKDILAKHSTKVSISKNIYYFISLSTKIRRYLALLTAVVVFVYLPIYAGLNSGYSTYAETYAWSATIAYLSGATPAAVLLVLYLMSLLISLYFFRNNVLNVISYTSKGMISKVFKRTVTNKNSTKANKAKADDKSTTGAVSAPDKEESKRLNVVIERKKKIALIVMLVLNVAIVTSINGCYVYISLKYSNTVVAICELLLATFKSVWTSILLFFIDYVESRIIKTVSKDKSRHINFLTVMVIVNNILLPCLALSLVNPDCFYNALYSKDPISATFSYSVCESYDDYTASTLTCFLYFSGLAYSATETITYTPPYSYSNECSSAILTSYVPVFLYTALFALLAGLLNPVSDISTEKFLRYAARYPDNKHLTRMVSLVTTCKRFADYMFDTEYSTDGEEFNQTGFCLSLNSSIIVLLTFGVMSPFLAVMTYLSISSTLLYAEYRVGKYLSKVSEPGNEVVNPMSNSTKDDTDDSVKPPPIEDVESEGKTCSADLFTKKVQELDILLIGMENRLIKSTWQVLPSIGLFYSVFIWDIAGDELGFTKALWGPILMMSGVMLVFAYPSIHYYLVTVDLKMRSRAVQRSDIYNPDVRMDFVYVNQDRSSSDDRDSASSRRTFDDTSVKGVQLMQQNPLRST